MWRSNYSLANCRSDESFDFDHKECDLPVSTASALHRMITPWSDLA
jgi:hypothetical protein